MPSESSSPQNPLTSSVEKLRHELDHWLEVAVSQGERALDKFGIRGGPGSAAVDIVESADHVRVWVNLPGVRSGDVEVSLAGNMLTVQAKLSAVIAGEHDTVHLRERPASEIRRSVALPIPVNPDDIVAELSDGVLQVRLAKSDSVKATHIPINTGE